MKVLVGAALAMAAISGTAAAEPLPFAPGERITMRVTYARLLAGRATMSVTSAEHGGRPILSFVQEVKSEGVFAWLFRYRVDNRLVALWDPASGCSYGIEKKLRQGRYTRDQRVRIDPTAGTVEIEDRGAPLHAFAVPPCVLDVLSAFYVARARGLPASGELAVPVYDSGRVYDLVFRVVGREVLDLPPPLGRRLPTTIVQPTMPPGSGLFAQEGELRVWVTDDARRIPVRARTSVAVGSVSADLESYVAGTVTASPSGGARPLPRSTSDTALPTRPTPRGSDASGSRSSAAPARRWPRPSASRPR
jgi:hypothetical protein